MPTPEDRDLVEAFLEFARSPGDTTPLSLAERVWLGLGTELLANRHRDELVDPDAWVVEVEHYAGYVGPFSALEVLSHGGEVEVSIGPHPHCASPPQPAPGAVADLRRVSVQPAGIESCLQWWTVDLFVSGAVEVEAVMLDLWEP